MNQARKKKKKTRQEKKKKKKGLGSNEVQIKEKIFEIYFIQYE